MAKDINIQKVYQFYTGEHGNGGFDGLGFKPMKKGETGTSFITGDLLIIFNYIGAIAVPILPLCRYYSGFKRLPGQKVFIISKTAIDAKAVLYNIK